MEERLTFTTSEVGMVEFARHRGEELAILTRLVEGGVDGNDGSHSRGGSNKRVFQQLPRHMRRRAMSHNPKRVPRRLMEIHKRELEKFPKKESKRPSRRFRRRPKQLLQEYNRRQRNFVWLETHIWHAKRFKMTPRWNYKIPLYPSDKSWRACYHGSQRAALLQDLSYLCCIQLCGVRELILENLSQLTSTDCGLTFASAMSQNGNFECSCMVYRKNGYPYNAICPVTFFWRSNFQNEESCLWIWSHPASFEELLNELVTTFSVKLLQSNEDHEQKSNEKLDLLKTIKFSKLSPKLTPFYERTPTYKNESVTLTVLKDTLVRFRIVGRWATAVLTQTLQLANTDEPHHHENRWWMKCEADARDALAKQAQFWEQLNKQPHFTQVPPGTIVGLVVRDPREQLPIQRCKIPPTIPENVGPCQPIDIPQNLSYSPIWMQDIRDEVTFTKKSDAEINSLRTNNLLPGTPINLKGESSRVPILLIQQPSRSSTSEVDAGWDLILPAGWAMAFWIPIIYRGARAGGYRENRLLAHEFGADHFPEDFPDTISGKNFEELESKQLLEKYLKYPPSKRPNYIKLGVSTPFSFPWSRLVSEWSSTASKNHEDSMTETSSTDYFVVRNKQVLKLLQRLTSPTERKLCDKTAYEKILNILGPDCYSHAIVACNLSISARGTLTKYALICKPCQGDVQRLAKGEPGELEPHHKDTKAKLRKAAKKQKTRNTMSALEGEIRDKLFSKENMHFATPNELVNSGNKPIIGFVKEGQFSLSKGKCYGVGFVALVALVELLDQSKAANIQPFVFVRSTHSFQYRAASFNIL